MQIRLPSSWHVVKLVEVANLAARIGWRGLKASEYLDHGPMLLSAANLRGGRLYFDDVAHISNERYEESPEIRLQNGDLLLVKDGAGIGRTALVTNLPDRATINSSLMRISPEAGIFPAFLFQFLNGQTFQNLVNQRVTGSATPHLFKRDLRELPVRVPPFAEQRRIVSTIESLQGRNSCARQAIVETEPLFKQFYQSVLRAAVSGRLTADWRAMHRKVETATELLSRIHTERHRRENSELAKYEAVGKTASSSWHEGYKEPKPVDGSGLNSLPHGWCWCRMEDVGDIQLGRQRSPRYHSGPNMRPYLRVMNVFEDRIDTEDVMEMNFSPADYERFRLEEGDILLNEGQSPELVGRSAIYRGEVPGACFTNTLVRFRPHAPLTSDYPQIVFLSYLKTGRFQQIASLTVNIAHLGVRRFADMVFPLPPLDEQTEIVRQVRKNFDQFNALVRAVAESESALSQLDQSILAKAFRGELVPQNPSDEPAFELLEMIRARRVKAAPIGDVVPKLSKERVMKTLDDLSPRYLSQIICRRKDRKISPNELFERSKLSARDFYTKLSSEVSAGHIREHKLKDPNGQIGTQRELIAE